ncbi:hypothetical protein XENTR_v10019565 [Xenopus tropicalis]|nr:hypothetical protein XENTR_v10019565 [Xenopus tropicalis]
MKCYRGNIHTQDYVPIYSQSPREEYEYVTELFLPLTNRSGSLSKQGRALDTHTLCLSAVKGQLNPGRLK